MGRGSSKRTDLIGDVREPRVPPLELRERSGPQANGKARTVKAQIGKGLCTKAGRGLFEEDWAHG